MTEQEDPSLFTPEQAQSFCIGAGFGFVLAVIVIGLLAAAGLA